MKLSNNTILITGGGSGIGYETAKLLAAKGNKVIICGRNSEKLEKAAITLNNVTAIQCDLSKEDELDGLVAKITKDFPYLNILFNNAGLAYTYFLSHDAKAWEKAKAEMEVNYLVVIRLTEKLLPLLSQQSEAAIINNTSVVAFVPGAIAPTYSASKAALHSYSQSLRLALGQSPVKVFEVMPPLVDTEFSKDIPGEDRLPASQVARELLEGLENNTYEIQVGFTKAFYQMYLQSPQKAFMAMNGVEAAQA